MRSCVGKGVRTHVKGLDKGEGDSASQLNRGAQWSQDACGLLKGPRHKGQPMACFAILAVLLAVEVFTTDGLR